MSPIPLITAGCLLLSGIAVVHPAKILFLYPIPYPSHYRAFGPVIKELAARGHQVTAYTTVPGEKSDKNFLHISITVDNSTFDMHGFNATSWRARSTISYIHTIWDYFSGLNEAALQSKELQALMQSEKKFDLLITEALFMEESMLAFGHKFHVPVVTLYPLFPGPWAAQLAGIPHSFSYIPQILLPYLDHMNFWQRMKNTLLGMYEIAAGNLYYLPIQERMMRKYFKYPGSESLPPIQQLISNISLHLVDSHQLMSSVRPYAPNVIDIGGTNIKTAGKLPQDLQKFMDEATDGVIYFSFGSYIDAPKLSNRFKNVLIETLKRVKQKVIIKWNEKIEGAPHILARAWLPQTEILAHPNCRLFITHGGFNSLMEAMSIGVPTIGIPFFSDQSHNVAWYQHRGVGLEVDYETTTISDFTEKINRIVYTHSFRENAKHVAKLYRDQPQTSLERAVFWVEYVIRHKGAHHLKPASVKMPYYQYLLLDVIAFLTVSTFLTFYIVYYLICKIMLLFRGTRQVSQEKKRT